MIGETEADVEERAGRLAAARNTTAEALRRGAIVGTPEQAAEQIDLRRHGRWRLHPRRAAPADYAVRSCSSKGSRSCGGGRPRRRVRPPVVAGSRARSAGHHLSPAPYG
ncbi:MAG: hypothetical protein U0531_18400 [Dehalococcoidia bacterium]